MKVDKKNYNNLDLFITLKKLFLIHANHISHPYILHILLFDYHKTVAITHLVDKDEKRKLISLLNLVLYKYSQLMCTIFVNKQVQNSHK